MQAEILLPAMSNESGSRNWLLHARYVRGEHATCLDLCDKLQEQTSNKHIYAHFIKGLVLADAGRLQEALERFHSCIKLHSQDPEHLKHVAKCLYRQGRFRLAFEAYLEADKLTRYPDAEVFCGLAECSWNLGDVERGVEWAMAAVQAGGGERAAALLAKLHLACDRVEAALQAFDQAMSAGACGADTLAAAGALRLRAGDPRTAFQLLGAALAQQPSQHGAALALAAMLMQHGDADAALARLKTALAAHPTCVAAHSNLGLALLGKRKYVAALTCLQRAACAAPLSARAAHNLAVGLLACKRTTSALCRLATAAALQPNQPYTMLLLGIALERLGDERADAAYSKALALRPEDPLLALNLAGRHARATRLSEAVAAVAHTARLLDMNPDPQLASSLSVLLNQLRDAGALVEESADAVPDPNEDTRMNDDEIEAKERKAGLIVLPPLVIGYEDLLDSLEAEIETEKPEKHHDTDEEEKPKEEKKTTKKNKKGDKKEKDDGKDDKVKE